MHGEAPYQNHTLFGVVKSTNETGLEGIAHEGDGPLKQDVIFAHSADRCLTDKSAENGTLGGATKTLDRFMKAVSAFKGRGRGRKQQGLNRAKHG
jgi:hypothetical protein